MGTQDSFQYDLLPSEPGCPRFPTANLLAESNQIVLSYLIVPTLFTNHLNIF